MILTWYAPDLETYQQALDLYYMLWDAHWTDSFMLSFWSYKFFSKCAD